MAHTARKLTTLLAICSCLALGGLAGCDDSSGGGGGGNDTGTTMDMTGDGTGTDTSTGGDTGGGDTATPQDTSMVGDTGAGDAMDTSNMCPSDRVCGTLCCDQGRFCINGSCFDSCSSGITCGPTGGLCCSSNETCLPDDTCGLMCDTGAAPCGTGGSARCCDAGQVCENDQCVLDCGTGERCNGVCCGDGEMCYQDACAAQCDNVAKLCGENNELCCGAAEVCLGGTTCVEPGDDCTLTEECAIDELCEPTLGKCVPRSAVDVCEFRPDPGVFSPVAGCTWRPPADSTAAGGRGYTWGDMGDVVMTPVVANVTDDNGDGETNTLDTPDIIFTSFSYADENCCTPYGAIRIVSGACNADGTMNTLFTWDDVWIDNSGGIAVGNLHPDTQPGESVPEIVATSRTERGTLALRRTADDGSAWELMWQSPYPDSSQMGSGGTPSIADLNQDGQPEVVVGNVILNGLDGSLIMDGDTVSNPVTGGTGGGVGNNSFLGPSSAVSDIDLDGNLEVIAGNTVYEWDGTNSRIECHYSYNTSNSGCQGGLPCDGFNAVGDFDSDPEGEIVIVRRGQVFVLDHDCTEKHIVDVPLDVNNEGDGPCNRGNESGPPTVADFDGDGEPEIGTAGADFYVVVDLQCTGTPLPIGCESEKILWSTLNHDCSSRSTASSVFDFEGDGKAEVVYADERDFFVFSGTDGTELFNDDTHSSNTRIEMPVIVDVDNDGKSEIVVAKATGNRTDEGLTVWEDADNNWVRTRRIWNQHGYHVTNITEDGQVPIQEDVNWLNTRLNNYRQNVQPGGLFDAPDLVVENIETDVSQCTVDGTLGFVVTVGNQGALGVPAGILVYVTITDDNGSVFDLGTQPTAVPLLPGQSTTLTFPFNETDQGAVAPFTVDVIVDDDGMGNGQYNECDEANNSQMSAPLRGCPVQ